MGKLNVLVIYVHFYREAALALLHSKSPDEGALVNGLFYLWISCSKMVLLILL